MPRGPHIDRTLVPHRIVTCQVRRAPNRAEFVHTPPRIKALVGAHRDVRRPVRRNCGKENRVLTLRSAGRRTHARAQRQVMPILDEHRHLIGQLRLTPVRFALTECLGRRSTRVSCAAWNRRSLAACPDLSVLNTSPAITGAIAGAILACNGARQVLPQVVSTARCSCTVIDVVRPRGATTLSGCPQWSAVNRTARPSGSVTTPQTLSVRTAVAGMVAVRPVGTLATCHGVMETVGR